MALLAALVRVTFRACADHAGVLRLLAKRDNELGRSA
jgi:hypothetical protein